MFRSLRARSVLPIKALETACFGQRFLSFGMRMDQRQEEQIKALQEFTACDISDALLKIQKPKPNRAARGGFLADLVPYAPSSPFATSPQPKVIAPATTLKLIDKSNFSSSSVPEANSIPANNHWVDMTEKDTILVVEQPRHQTNAVIGGMMAARMNVRGVRGCVVSGRVRDLVELKNSKLPIWAAGKSTVGFGAETKALARNVSVLINDVDINPGDLIFCDPIEGVVVIPQELVDQVIELVPKLVAADDKVKEDVQAGSSVYEAFKKHRG